MRYVPAAAILALFGCQFEYDNPAELNTHSGSNEQVVQLESNEDGNLEVCDEDGTCVPVSNPDNCATLVITIDTATGAACERCLDAEGAVIFDRCEETNVECTVVTVPDPDCMVCAYVGGAVIYSTCGDDATDLCQDDTTCPVDTHCSTADGECLTGPRPGCFGECVGEPGTVNPEPVGDGCENPIDLSGGVATADTRELGVSLELDTVNFMGTGCWYWPSATGQAVFTYTPATAGTLVVSTNHTGTMIDTVVAIFTACSRDNLLECHDNIADNNPRSSARAQVEAGLPVWVVVGGFPEGMVHLTAQVLPNLQQGDDCADVEQALCAPSLACYEETDTCVACLYTEDGTCDEPEGTDLCAEGTDVIDCTVCPERAHVTEAGECECDEGAVWVEELEECLVDCEGYAADGACYEPPSSSYFCAPGTDIDCTVCGEGAEPVEIGVCACWDGLVPVDGSDDCELEACTVGGWNDCRAGWDCRWNPDLGGMRCFPDGEQRLGGTCSLTEDLWQVYYHENYSSVRCGEQMTCADISCGPSDECVRVCETVEDCLGEFACGEGICELFPGQTVGYCK